MNNESQMSRARIGELCRETRETRIAVRLDLDGVGKIDVQSGLGFLDHMLTLLAFHARWDLALTAEGDLEIDDHHTVEDCALALGAALDQALGDKRGIRRFGHALAPLDESLARCVVDFSGRPVAVIELSLSREKLGDVACENITHFFRSLAVAAKMTIHVDVLRGENDHHRAEAAFKALALAIRDACQIEASNKIPSTKGSL